MPQAREGNRFKTGDDAETTGSYVFDGYTDGTSEPEPTEEEQVIELEEGDTFPPIRTGRKGAWWKLQDESEEEADEESDEESEADDSDR